MIHSAITGSFERCIAVLLEHLGGALPTWLSPVQVQVLPIGEEQHEYAEEVFSKLKEAGIRTEIDKSGETLAKRVRETKTMKIPYIIFIGKKEVVDNQVTLQSRTEEKTIDSITNIISKLTEEIRTRA